MKKSEKITYRVDPHNRLEFLKSNENLKKYRTVTAGTFKIDENNSLIYHVKKSSDHDLPQQIKFSGSWSLDKNHNLILTLDKWNNNCYGNELVFKGDIVSVESNMFSFAITTKDSSGDKKAYTLHLKGIWRADKYNRITFNVIKKNATSNKLTLSGTWDINKQNQIVYSYTKTHLKKKIKSIHAVTFKGHWDIPKKYRLIYVLDKTDGSSLDFKVSLGKPDKRGLKYELGIGTKPTNKKFTIFGNWKINEKLGILFEVPYEKGKLEAIVFGATCKLGKNYALDVKLRNELNKPLGLNLKLSKNFTQDQGEMFIKAISENKELTILAGIGFRW